VLFHSKHSFWNTIHYKIRIIRAPDSLTAMIYCSIYVKGGFIRIKNPIKKITIIVIYLKLGTAITPKSAI
jgi:hypothetical protein